MSRRKKFTIKAGALSIICLLKPPRPTKGKGMYSRMMTGMNSNSIPTEITSSTVARPTKSARLSYTYPRMKPMN